VVYLILSGTLQIHYLEIKKIRIFFLELWKKYNYLLHFLENFWRNQNFVLYFIRCLGVIKNVIVFFDISTFILQQHKSQHTCENTTARETLIKGKTVNEFSCFQDQPTVHAKRRKLKRKKDAKSLLLPMRALISKKQKIFTVSQNSYPRRLSFRLQVVNKLSFVDLLL
jgi:hypothetical protein